MSMRDYSRRSDNGNNATGVPSGVVMGTPQQAQAPADPHADAREMLIDYSKFANADPTLYRDDVIAQLMSVLIGRDKPNALLVGGAGTGKTRIVEELARLLAAKDPRIPKTLAGAHIYELPLANVVSGSSFVGQLEEKMNAVIELAADPKENAILFMDEIHQLSAGHDATYGQMAQILKSALARGRIRVIGATTLQESQNMMRDPALSRRFTRLIVDELTRAQTVEVMRAAWPSLSAHYKGTIAMTDDVFEVIARVADNYAKAGQHRPDTAITLLDRACADAVVERASQLATLDPQIAQSLMTQPIVVTESGATRCARRIATGQSRRVHTDFDALSEALSRIHGQDAQIAEITRMLRLRELSLFPQRRPLTILCAGPSGVGKSSVARIVSNVMTGLDPITLNMAEFVTYASLNRIVGSPAGYVGSDSHAELPFDMLESNPYQVILLDEMEKGCREVQRFFMSAFDDGYCRTNSGKTIDFSKCIFFVTTNAAHTTGATRHMGFTPDQGKGQPHKADPSSLSQWFDVELLNRFQLMLTFSEIGRDTYRDILADTYAREARRINMERPRLALPDTLADDELDDIVDRTYERDFGARPAERAVRELIEDRALALTSKP